MTRLFLAAGVAALAIATPAAAKPGGGGGGGGNPHGDNGGGNPHGGGGGASQAAQGGGGGGGGGRGHGGGGGGGAVPAFVGGGGGGGHGHGGGGGFQPQAFFGGGHGHGGGGGYAAPQRVERQQFQAPQMRAQRQQSRGFERQQARQQARGFERQHPLGFERQQARQQARGFERQQARQQARGFERQQFQGHRAQQVQQQAIAQQQFGGLNGKQAKFANREFVQNVNPAPYQALTYANNVSVVPYAQAQQFVGVPLGQVTNFVDLSPLPTSIQYLYPNTPNYYYQYGDGYLYQVNRSDNLIAALIPLLAGGFLPGTYLPQPYMASYVPNYYGLNSFYPDYGDVCNRYYDGVIYQVDCDDGYVENVIPMYAGGYGVGQILPSAYSYYNVPMQYRSMYYDTPDYGYWYSPGAIYQYDQRSSMITSVASLLSPGFTVGQALPLGYDVYNVPYDYRATYYDTPNAWYRYNNGYIYQVDPVTQIVTAVVASLLT